ncbi:TatD family hydrolase [bacterium]|nr:TatD family hydrolase [bacterium]
MSSAQTLALVDTHCHLADEKFSTDMDSVCQRATAAGVTSIVAVGDKLDSSRRALEIARAWPDAQLVAAVGVHPHHAENWTDETDLQLRALCREGVEAGKVVALGETGLDFYYDNSPREQQAEIFAAQAEIAREFHLPLVIHVRDAWDTFFEMIDRLNLPQIGGVVHCFSGNAKQAVRLTEMGFYLGVGGVITFKKSDDLRESVRAVPLESLLLETDAPYLAPVPMRGDRNEPAYVAHTAAVLAQVLEKPLEEIARVTTANAVRLLGKKIRIS